MLTKCYSVSVEARMSLTSVRLQPFRHKGLCSLKERLRDGREHVVSVTPLRQLHKHSYDIDSQRRFVFFVGSSEDYKVP